MEVLDTADVLEAGRLTRRPDVDLAVVAAAPYAGAAVGKRLARVAVRVGRRERRLPRPTELKRRSGVGMEPRPALKFTKLIDRISPIERRLIIDSL